MSKQEASTEQGAMNVTCFLAGSSHIALKHHVDHSRNPHLTSLEFLLQTLEEVEQILRDDDYGPCGLGEGPLFPTSTSRNGNNQSASCNGNNQSARDQQDHCPSKQ
jgi:hypothetical protein